MALFSHLSPTPLSVSNVCTDATNIPVHIDVLFQNAKKIGVDIKLNTKVVELITNTEANEVLGVKAESKGKPLYVRATKGVVIATGGFCGDVNMIDKFILDSRGALTFASANSEGQA